MYFQHSAAVWADFPELVAGVVVATGITAPAEVAPHLARLTARAQARLAAGPESEFPQIRAWRRAFVQLGLKPTQYRCAAEALLRRYRREGALPRLHPLVDLCNAVSLAYAVPVAALDLAQVAGGLEVRHATGAEPYLAFSGEWEQPRPGEITFVDAAGRAHARRWTNRQSALSAVREQTGSVLIVAEALHESADRDVPELLGVLEEAIRELWSTSPARAILRPAAPRYEFLN